MPRILGVSCSPTVAFLALLVDGAIQIEPDRMPWPVGEASERLAVAQDEIADLLNELGVDKVAVLLPERDPRFKWPYETAATRASMETLFRLAAVRGKIPVEVLDRGTVRSRLKLTGKLDLHLDRVAPAGKAWRQGRGEAALAAAAAELA